MRRMNPCGEPITAPAGFPPHARLMGEYLHTNEASTLTQHTKSRGRLMGEYLDGQAERVPESRETMATIMATFPLLRARRTSLLKASISSSRGKGLKVAELAASF
jgi:hypothetical protein